MAKYFAFIGNLALSVVTAAELPAPIGRPWFGYGLNLEPQPGGGTNPGTYTQTQAELDDSRIGAIRPQIARVTWTTTGFSPTGKVGVYDWTTTWAKNEFLQLDRLKARNIPIMTGWWDTAPWDATGKDHATAVVDFLDFLISEKNYTNIFAWNGINEPNHRDPTTYARWKTEVANIKQAIIDRGLNIEVIGPGTQDLDASADWLDAAASEMSDDLGGYAIHYYPTEATGIQDGKAAPQVKGLVDGVYSRDTSNKPFYIEELGWKYDWDSSNDAQPNVINYSYGLNMGDLGIQVARVGVAAPMAWRLADFGSPKIWGMYDGSSGETGLRPWSYSWTMLSRAFPKGATMYAPAADIGGARILVGSTGSASSRRWSFAGANRNSNQVSKTLTLPNSNAKAFTRYYYFDGNRVKDSLGFPGANGTVSANSNDEVTLVIPANSMVVLSNM